MPAEMLANRLASDEPTSRTVDVEQFCSWSACSTNSRSSALVITGSGVYGSVGSPNVIRRKFSTRPSELSGYSAAWPTDFLYAYAAIVGILASSRTVDNSTFGSSNGFRLSW
jgi:hypothetical protein